MKHEAAAPPAVTPDSSAAPYNSPILIALYVIAGLAGLIYFFRFSILSGGEAVIGDPGDARLVMALLEHWFRVVQGLAVPASPNFFYPARGVLAYSESFLLFSVAYIPARLAGLNTYTAYQFTMAAVLASGYAGMALLLRRGFQLNSIAAITCSLLFAYSRVNFMLVFHPQMYAAAFIPWMFLAIVAYWKRLKLPSLARLPYAVSFLTLLMLVALTSVYVVWFLALFTCLAAFVLLIVSMFRPGIVRSVGMVAVWLGANAWHILILLLYLGIAAIPFALIYVSGMPSKTDNQWGMAISTLIANISPFIGNVFIALVVLTTLLATFATAGLTWTRKMAIPNDQALFATICGWACIMGWMLMMRFGETIPWWYVFRHFPAAWMIRVVLRFQQVLNFFMAVIAAIGLSMAIRFMQRRRRDAALYALAGLCAFLLYEQHQPWQTLYGKSEQIARLSSVPRPPGTCRSFYMTFDRNDKRNTFEKQIDAILLAERFNLPTINGYSGRVPKDWDFPDPAAPEYVRAARRWAADQGVQEGLCEFDLPSATWTGVY